MFDRSVVAEPTRQQGSTRAVPSTFVAPPSLPSPFCSVIVEAARGSLVVLIAQSFNRLSTASTKDRIGLVVVLVGIALRAARFLDPRPLWLDEALLALNILGRPPQMWLQPLQEGQISPVGFLGLEWVITRVGGAGEATLRFLPLLASIVALVAFARLARRLLDPGVALLATSLAALSPLLVYYGAEVKSYQFDFLCIVLMMDVSLSLIANDSKQHWFKWALAACFASLFSIAAPFLVGGSALVLLIFLLPRKVSVQRIAVAALPAASLFVLQFLTLNRVPGTVSVMQVFWADGFLPFAFPEVVIRSAHLARNLWVAVLTGEHVLAGLPGGIAATLLALSLVGVMALWRRSIPGLLLALLPVVLAALASFAKVWPLAPRLLLFAAPAVILSLAAGVAAVASAAPTKTRQPLFASLSALLLLVCALGLRHEMQRKGRFAQLPKVLSEIHNQPEHPVALYLSRDLEPACEYYLRWHPERFAFGSDEQTTSCSLSGKAMIASTWPIFQGLLPGAVPAISGAIDSSWLANEGRTIRTVHEKELWVVLGPDPALRKALPAWLESAGAKLIGQFGDSTLPVLQYSWN